MSNPGETEHVEAENQRLVDLVSAVLVDPNLHTDLRMRLHAEISELLHAAHAPSPAIAHAAHRPKRQVAANHLPDLLESVLSDPNLHTDLRMRLYGEIPRLVEQAQEHAGGRVETP